MFGFGRTNAKTAALVIALRADGTYRILTDRRPDFDQTKSYQFNKRGIDAYLFVRSSDVEMK